MFAYVKNLAASGEEAFYTVHTTRIFHFVSDSERVKFDAQKHDVSVSYGIVIGKNLVKHQVLRLADSEAELTEAIKADTTSKLRSVPCPKRLSTGPVTLQLSEVKLRREKQTDKSEARQTAGHKRNAKLLHQMKAKSSTAAGDGSGDPAAADPPKKRKCTAPSNPESEPQAGPSGLSAHTSLPVSDNVPVAQSTDKDEATSTKVEELERQLQEALGQLQQVNVELGMAHRELEAYRAKCTDLERNKSSKSVDEKLARLQKGFDENKAHLEQLVSDVAEIKEFIAGAKERAEHKKSRRSSTLCQLSGLRDVAPHSSSDFSIPDDEVHMGEGKYFVKKLHLVVAEKASGLRPRVKRILSFMFKGELKTLYNKKAKDSTQVLEVTDDHLHALIAVLKAFKWTGKLPDLTFDHIQRELSKALTELKNEKFPTYQEEVDAYLLKHPQKKAVQGSRESDELAHSREDVGANGDSANESSYPMKPEPPGSTRHSQDGQNIDAINDEDLNQSYDEELPEVEL